MKLSHLTIVLVVVLLSGCGKKGPVQPLRKPLPEAPPQISLSQTGQRLVLGWQIPAKNQDGTELQNLAGFRIYRMEYDPADDCPECTDRSTLLREVDMEFPREIQRQGDRLFFRDAAVKPGTGYSYRVTAVTDSGREGAFATARRPLLYPPPPPGGLSAQGLDKMVRLSWSEPFPTDAAKTELLGYNVYRALAEQPFAAQPVNEQILESPGYDDFGLENGKTYRYVVRSVARQSGQTVESTSSEPVTVIPRPGR